MQGPAAVHRERQGERFPGRQADHQQPPELGQVLHLRVRRRPVRRRPVRREELQAHPLHQQFAQSPVAQPGAEAFVHRRVRVRAARRRRLQLPLQADEPLPRPEGGERRAGGRRRLPLHAQDAAGPDDAGLQQRHVPRHRAAAHRPRTLLLHHTVQDIRAQGEARGDAAAGRQGPRHPRGPVAQPLRPIGVRRHPRPHPHPDVRDAPARHPLGGRRGGRPRGRQSVHHDLHRRGAHAVVGPPTEAVRRGQHHRRAPTRPLGRRGVSGDDPVPVVPRHIQPGALRRPGGRRR